MKLQEKVLLMGRMRHPDGAERLRELVGEVVEIPTLDEPRLLAEVKDASVLFIKPLADRTVVRSTTTTLIQHGSRLKALATSARSSDFVDLQAAAARKLPVIFTNLYDHNVAEHQIALMLCAAKKIQHLAREFRAGRFRYDMRGDWAGEELYGKTAGIVGFGAIGRALSLKCRLGFNMNVLAFDPYVDRGVARVLSIELVDSLRALLANADFVCLCAKNSPETRHMIGAEQLRQMKRTAYLTNITPGLIDEQALIEALRRGEIAGAGLDVFDPDPPDPQSNPLFDFPNVAISPHMGGDTLETMRRVAVTLAESIVDYLRGKTPQSIYWPQ